MKVFDLTNHISRRELLWDWQDWMNYIPVCNDNSNVVTLWTT